MIARFAVEPKSDAQARTVRIKILKIKAYMNKLILLLSSVFLSLTASAVQYGYLSALEDVESDGLILNTGDVCKILAFNEGSVSNSQYMNTSVHLYLPNLAGGVCVA